MVRKVKKKEIKKKIVKVWHANLFSFLSQCLNFHKALYIKLHYAVYFVNTGHHNFMMWFDVALQMNRSGKSTLQVAALRNFASESNGIKIGTR
jgi:hypothetical protein